MGRGSVMMLKRDILLFLGDQHKFERWLKGSAVIGSIFAAVIFIMAIAQSGVMRSRPADAGIKASEVGAPAPLIEQSGVLIEYRPVF